MIRRLHWAGLRMELGPVVLFIDPQIVFARKPEIGSDAALLETKAANRFAAITHAHADHFDPPALKLAIGAEGSVACHSPVAPVVAAAGLRPLPLALHEGASLTGFDGDDIFIVPVPAMDGWGDDQVSWIIVAGNRRFFHGGDTIWHGRFRHLGRQYGPFDAAFLPINGVRQPQQIEPALETRHTLGPDEAVEAAIALQARQLVPIHYGRKPTSAYVETADAEAAAVAHGKRRNISVQIVKPGELVPLS
ncbi:MAG TPA: MBL fold metallo-hydrolase [Myxococcales bacterium]|nr:MBL fold metallo-hydrolase [Myxococcales bacterium]